MTNTPTEKTMADTPQLMCRICGDPILPEPVSGWSGGHNAEPLNDGRCCNDCNMLHVVPERLRRLRARKP